MIKAGCPSCGKASLFEPTAGTTAECPLCFEEFDISTTVSEVLRETEEVAGLTLIYQLNQQRIEIPASPKTFLGRDSFGADVLSEIFSNGKPVISRRHCSIELREDKFYLQDENSLNGTYYGVNKIDCKESPQVIEQESLVYLGEEPFLARIRFKQTEDTPSKPADPVKEIREYRCNEPGCGFKSVSFHPVCPGCHTYHSLIAIYE